MRAPGRSRSSAAGSSIKSVLPSRTARIRRPGSDARSPRAMVSTSGSSGIIALLREKYHNCTDTRSPAALGAQNRGKGEGPACGPPRIGWTIDWHRSDRRKPSVNKQSKPIPPSTRKWWLGSLAAAVILGWGLWMARPCMSGPSTAPPQTAAQGEQKTASAIPGEEPRYTNALIREKSPYLLMHAHNPVDWYPWGEEALEKARREQKPIFLSIGYYTCHWCHVMERESFSDPAIAEIM